MDHRSESPFPEFEEEPVTVGAEAEEGTLPPPKQSGGKRPNRVLNVFLAVMMALMVAVSAFSLGMIFQQSRISEEARLMEWIVRVMEEYAIYYDEEEYQENLDLLMKNIGTNILMAGVYRAGEGDRFFDVLTPEETAAFLAENQNRHQGLGINMPYVSTGPTGDLPVVSNVLGADSPAGRAGLRRYDRLYRLTYAVTSEGDPVSYDPDAAPSEGVSVKTFGPRDEAGKDLTRSDFLSFFDSFPADVTFSLEVLRPVQEGETFVYDEEQITRFDGVSLFTYSADYTDYYDSETDPELGLDEDTALIVLKSFDAGASESFAADMETFRQKGKTRLILDLRFNGGGLLTECTAIASYLVSDGGSTRTPMAVDVEKKSSSVIMTDQNLYAGMNFGSVAVLANSNSASATELLLMAMDYYGTADCIIGSTTYGKGISQNYFNTRADFTGFTVKVTVSQIFNMDYDSRLSLAENAAHTIHGVGISPDVESPDAVCADYASDPAFQAALACFAGLN